MKRITMHHQKGLFLLLINIFGWWVITFAQTGRDTLLSREAGSAEYTPAEASAYLSGLLNDSWLWGEETDTLRISIVRLLDQYHAPFDSILRRLETYPYARLNYPETALLKRDTIPLRWLVDGYFYADTVPLFRSPVITRTRVITRLPEMPEPVHDTLLSIWRSFLDTAIYASDTITEQVIDTAYLASKRVTLHRMEAGEVIPPLIAPDTFRRVELLSDGSAVVIITREQRVDYRGENMLQQHGKVGWGDSLQMAAAVLLEYLSVRDSILLHIEDIDGTTRPLWVTGGRDDVYRFWAKNSLNDSITLWIGNPDHHTLSLRLEEGVNVKVPERLEAYDLDIVNSTPDRSLAETAPLEEIPFAWKHRLISSVAINQNYLSNWSRGGASSLSTLVDITGRSDYRNRKTLTKFENSGRLRYGSIRTKEQGFRTSNDILEFNSQYNRVFIEKIDFSALMYFKSQVARGYKYPNDSVVVSKFLNPGSFTVGVGFEYKPFKHTTLNYSPFSYKNTFVLDSANINPTAHGVESGQRSKQEFGGQLLMKNNMQLLEGLKMSHSVRLFSSYLNEPQNIDVDWEMGFEKEINWYFTIKLTLHLIYDDDIMLPIVDKEGIPVLWPDGTPRKGPRTQLNQFLGLTLTFRL